MKTTSRANETEIDVETMFAARPRRQRWTPPAGYTPAFFEAADRAAEARLEAVWGDAALELGRDLYDAKQERSW